MNARADETLASRVFAAESALPGAAYSIERVLTKLDELFSDLLGAMGYRALLSRALFLARPSHPWMSKHQPLPSTTLDPGTLCSLFATADHESARAGAVDLVAHLLDLLGQFLGEDLTSQRLVRTWGRALERPAPAREGT